MTYDFVKIGRRIAGERAKKGWNQTELINQLSQLGVRISRNTISKLESGKLDETNIPVDLIICLCELFGCEAGYLLGEEGYRGKTRSATDVSKATGLDAGAVEGLKQIQTGTFKGELNTFVNRQYEIYYSHHANDHYDATQVLNWLFKNDYFKDLIFYLAYKLQTVEYQQAYPQDFEFVIKSIFDDYKKDNMPMLEISSEAFTDMVTPTEWDKLIHSLGIRPENEEQAEKIISGFTSAVLHATKTFYK